jgi:hypothetical protein
MQSEPSDLNASLDLALIMNTSIHRQTAFHDQTHQSCVVKETPLIPTTTTNQSSVVGESPLFIPTTATNTMPFSCSLKRSMPCTDLLSMGSSISLKELCAAFDEQEFSSGNLLRSHTRQRMPPLYVIEEDKRCNPATDALEAALALDTFDDVASPFESGDVNSSLALFFLNEDFLENFTLCTPRD